MNIKQMRTLSKGIFQGLSQGGTTKAAGIFKRTVSAAQRTFNKSTIKNDLSIKMSRGVGQGISKASKWVGGKISIGANMAGSTPVAKSLGATARAVGRNKIVRGTGRVTGAFGRGSLALGKAMAVPSLITVGAVGMLGVSIMNGANNAAKDIIFERYMADQRFSRDMLLQSRLGTAMGTARMNKYGSTVGLSNSLSRTRHGASY